MQKLLRLLLINFQYFISLQKLLRPLLIKYVFIHLRVPRFSVDKTTVKFVMSAAEYTLMCILFGKDLGECLLDHVRLINEYGSLNRLLNLEQSYYFMMLASHCDKYPSNPYFI